jgi:MFS family permease
MSSFAALKRPHFRTFLAGTVLAMMADNIEHVITYWVLFEKFHSPVLAGFAVISHWTPFLLLSVYFGGLADRSDCRRLIQIAQVMYMSVSVIWAVLFFTNTIQVWHACVLLVVHGVAGVFWTPAEQMMIHDLVGMKDLPSAVRLNATGRQLGQLFGPAVGGVLMLWFGPSMGLLVNAVIYLPLTLWLIRAPYTGHLQPGRSTRRVRWSDAIDVMREVADNRPVVTMVILGGAASLFIGNAFQATSGPPARTSPTRRCWAPTPPARWWAAFSSTPPAGCCRPCGPRSCARCCGVARWGSSRSPRATRSRSPCSSSRACSTWRSIRSRRPSRSSRRPTTCAAA